MKILMLEDEYMLSRAIRTYLLNKNFFVDHFDNGIDVMKAVKNREYDFFILDINTPFMSGLECLKELAVSHPNIPKIIMSAYHDIDYITEAFDLGCSDYLKKPFNLKELEIRIKRLTTTVNESYRENNSQVNLSQNYIYDTNENLFYYKNKIEKFTKREHALFVLFVTNSEQILTEENIRSFIWGEEDVEDSTIRSLINRLRGKLKEDLIENIRGYGYLMKKSEHA